MGLIARSRRPTLIGRSSTNYIQLCHRLLCFTIILLLIQQPSEVHGIRNRRKSRSKFLRPASVASVRGDDILCSPSQIGKEVEVKGISGPVPRDPNYRIVCRCIPGDSKNKLECTKEINICATMLQGCHYLEKPTKGNTNCEIQCRGCVSSNGTRVESGQSWRGMSNGKCVQNLCFSGVITSSPLVCPPTWCKDPMIPVRNEKDEGYCTNTKTNFCPSCAGCSRNGIIYKDGETKTDINDGTECKCSGGNLTCTQKVCPVLPCPSNLMRTPKGKFCPECVRKQEFTRINNMCNFRGKVYRVGSKYNVGVCSECTCTKSQTTVCKKTICPKLDCPLYQQRRIPGECCPHCLTGIGPIEPGNKLTTTQKPKPDIPDKKCKVGDTEYGSGIAWKSGPNGCNQCTCLNGVTKCTTPSCSINSKEDCPLGADLEFPNGQCCPRCKIRPGICTVFGDPHYKTFDGRVFNFQGSCKYLLSKECDNDGDNSLNGKNSSFSVRITNDARNSTGFSWTRTITVRLKTDKISLMQNRRDGGMRVKINGKKIDLSKPFVKIGFYSMVQEGYRLVLRTNEGISILWDGVSFLEMKVPPKYRNRLCGLCGNFNGDSNDDFNGRHGELYNDGMTFGNSWRVGGYRACSIHPQDMSKGSFEPRHNCSQTWNSRIESDRYCNAIHSTMFEKCARVIKTIKPDYYFNACKMDMCECPTDQCHCEVITAYARECENLGLEIQGWREHTGCVNVTSYRYGKRRNRKNGLFDDSSKNDVLRPTGDTLNVPSWLSSNTEPNDLGRVLPGYSPNQATNYKPKRRFLDRAIDYKDILTPKERKRIRNKERRRQRRKLKRERKRKRRLEKKRRRQRERERNKAKRKKLQQKKHESELKRLGHEVGLDVVESKDKNGDIKRRLNWSKFRQAQKSTNTRTRPPFEELLSGSFLDSIKDDNEDEEYQEYDNLLDYDSAIVQEGFIPNTKNASLLSSPNPSENSDKGIVNMPTRRGKTLASRTPLPLFDAEDEPYNRRRTKSSRHSRSIETQDVSKFPIQKSNRERADLESLWDRIRKGTKVHFN